MLLKGRFQSLKKKKEKGAVGRISFAWGKEFLFSFFSGFEMWIFPGPGWIIAQYLP